MKKGILFSILAFLIAFDSDAKTDKKSWCGTQRGLIQTQHLLHKHQRHQKEIIRAEELNAGQFSTDVGQIAVIEGSPATIIEPNDFDLQGKKLSFTESSGVYKLTLKGGSVSGSQGNSISLTDDDAELVQFTNGFTFPFYGTTYTAVYVHSDGNLSFVAADPASSPRTPFRVLTGPPRIAPFFIDLNPATGGEVNVLQSSKKFRVTWNNVPEFGTSNSNTIQVTLSKNGNIQIVFGSTVQANDAVVGIAPGGTGASDSDAEFVDYSHLGSKSGIEGAILEGFASISDIDYFALFQVFHQTHKQNFDLITIFTDRTYLERPSFAFFSWIQNQIQGINVPQFDFSDFVGSSKLQGFLMMDNINKYPDDPNEEVGGLGTNTTLDVMGQEMGHRWVAFPRIANPGLLANELLGRDNQHWSWFLDSDASVAEGNNWQDNGNGTFTSIEATARYSLLDRYLMGLIPPSAVPPFFVLRGPGDPSAPPEVGPTITAQKFDVTVNDIIAVEGPRVPASDQAQKKWRLAFIYFIQPGTSPDPQKVAKIDQIRREWTGYFKRATGGKGKVKTKL